MSKFYHIIINNSGDKESVIRYLLETVNVLSIKHWQNIPNIIQFETDQDIYWVDHPDVISINSNNTIRVQDETPVYEQYEIKISNSQVETTISNLISIFPDYEFKTYNRFDNSIFVVLDKNQYPDFIKKIQLNSILFSNIIAINQNSNPIREYTRVLDLARYNWGLARITHRTNSFYESIRFTRTGADVNVYLIDTGVFSNHLELKGKIDPVYRYDAFRTIGDPNYAEPDSKMEIDENGNIVVEDHGTHVASIIVGNNVGVAIEANVIPVRVVSPFEESLASNLIDAVDWIISTNAGLNKPAIANISLIIDSDDNSSPSISEILVSALMAAGITTVVAAGNNSTDAFFSAPANVGATRSVISNNGKNIVSTTFDLTKKPIVVGASVYPHGSKSGFDELWANTNYGDVVDIFAPGVEIYGATIVGNGTLVNFSNNASYTLKTGTSMSCPFITAIAALFLQDNPLLTPIELRELIINCSTTGAFEKSSLQHKRVDGPFYDQNNDVIVVEDKLFSPNRLSYVWFTLTEVTWQTSNIEEVLTENTEQLYYVEATSTDYYSDREKIEYSVITVDPENLIQNNVIYTEVVLDYVSGIIPVNRQLEYFRTKPVYVPEDKSFYYIVKASDGRTSKFKRFDVLVKNIPEPPVWISPNAGALVSSPLVMGCEFFRNQIECAGSSLSMPIDDFVAVHPDGLHIDYILIPINSLPPGVSFTVETQNDVAYLTGKIQRIPYSETPFVYEFLVRAIASNGMIAERYFYIECTYVNEQHYFSPSWLSSLFEFSTLYPGVRKLADAYLGNTFYTQIHVINPDKDPLTYKIDFVPGISNSAGIFNGELPTGLILNQKGEIEGISDPNVPDGMYFFRLNVTDTSGYTISQDFMIQLSLASDSDSDDSDQIFWITPAGNLGTIFETFPSHVGVEARTQTGQPVSYSLVANVGFPDGIDIDPNTGLIIGLMPFVDATIEYEFTIRASVGSRFVDRTFSFTIAQLYNSTNTLNVKSIMQGYDRIDIVKWFTSFPEILSETRLFRFTDKYFGKSMYPSMYLINGLNKIEPTELQQHMIDYHKRMNLWFGSVTYSPAYDATGKHIYDVIYLGVIDPNRFAGGFNNLSQEEILTLVQSNPYDNTWYNVENKEVRFYPNSLKNVREDLISTVDGRNGIGINGQEGFPLWMRTKNKTASFTAGVVIAYVNAGLGLKVSNELIAAGFNKEFLGRSFTLDRYYVSELETRVTTLFDVVNGIATTIFDDPTMPIVCVPGTGPDFCNTDTSEYTQQTYFDVTTTETGKYFKFEDDLPIIENRQNNPYR